MADRPIDGHPAVDRVIVIRISGAAADDPDEDGLAGWGFATIPLTVEALRPAVGLGRHWAALKAQDPRLAAVEFWDATPTWHETGAEFADEPDGGASCRALLSKIADDVEDYLDNYPDPGDDLAAVACWSGRPRDVGVADASRVPPRGFAVGLARLRAWTAKGGDVALRWVAAAGDVTYSTAPVGLAWLEARYSEVGGD